MAMDIDSDVGFLDPDTLQLHELSPSIRKSNPHIVDELFSQWLSLPDTSRLVRSLVADAESGVSLNLVGKSTATNSASSHSLPSIFPGGIGSSRTPPLSPRSIAKQRVANDISSKGSPLKLINEPVREAIPQFYFGSGPPPSNDMKENFLSKVNPFFSLHLDVVKVNEFKSVTKEICKLPSYLSTALFRKIDVNCNGHVSREQFIHYWMTSNMLTVDLATRVYNILKEPVHNYLVQDDFKPALQELLASHSGLQFLQTTPEFQERYAETVIYRIFYYVNRSGNGRLTLRELKRGNLIAAMQQVDEEEDINKVLKYFSYEHFYVIYCKFWELDNDHDFFIDKEGLVKYSDHALTYRIVDRIFSQIPRKFTSIVEGKMSYEDFVYFILAEEDKTSEPSLEYWFKCIDLDGNGALTSNEMQFFFEEQLHRMECIGQVPMLFEDILCQIFDMVGPKNGGCITLQDIKGSKLGGTVFNILFNLNKFTSIESRETYLIHQEHGGPILTEWDRFARREYIRLSVEEDVEDDFNGSEDVWEESLEAPF